MKNIWKKYSYLVLLLFLILGMFDSRVAIAAIICMVGPILTAFFKGRYWCGNICPRGSFYDHVVSHLSPKRKTPWILKSALFRILVLTAMMSYFIPNLISSWGNPYQVGMLFYRLIVMTTIIGLVLSAFFNHRSWCAFCPMGTIASFVTKIKGNKKGLKVSTSCVSCNICAKNCPMGIKPQEFKGNVISHPDCINCKVCVYKCPKKSIN